MRLSSSTRVAYSLRTRTLAISLWLRPDVSTPSTLRITSPAFNCWHSALASWTLVTWCPWSTVTVFRPEDYTETPGGHAHVINVHWPLRQRNAILLLLPHHRVVFLEE